ncbi:MAG: M1 family metallopeptidase [Cryomorphaceae bacterium]|nr:M1 family metallopeptidase [Cryomorphaceae bacterium]
MTKFFQCAFLVQLTIVPFLIFGQQTDRSAKFKQLYEELPTANSYRTAAGAPGHEYYQQKADYDMDIRLDDEKQRIYGEQTITYHNNSPDELTYLWVQLDQNMRARNSMTKKIETNALSERVSTAQLKRMLNDFDGGFKLEYVQQTNGRELPYTVNHTMMRIDLPQPLKSGGKFSFKVKWWYNINNRMEIGGRSGYEYFEDDDNYLYTIAQFFPRMAVYNEVDGWQNKQFLGTGEFTLPFGDYKVNITVPADHVVTATGVLKNESSVLTRTQRNRLSEARKSNTPVLIITESEALENEKSRAKDNKTWTFEAENVRDFAFASSRKFIWDGMNQTVGNKNVLCMSLYPKEGNPLWEKYSTKVVAHTVRVYSDHTIDYPYPVAISVHTKWIGMEYPMICFNGGRPEPDGTYSEATKYGMIGVIIHEVGHNFFPMIINSDERQWTWMDEGLNTFMQFITEQEWDVNYPSRRGPSHKIVDYMKGDKNGMVPIMTNSESILQFGNNAYGKAATALNILRETIMGRELFDYAFKEYARRWAFKHPTPADFFRTMEDASAVDLDWFWRGWFYSTDHCDIALDDVRWYQINTKNPEVEFPIARQNTETENRGITFNRNAKNPDRTVVARDPETRDFYTDVDRHKVTALDQKDYQRYLATLDDDERALLDTNLHFYELHFRMVGGLVMPVILEFTFEDGSREVVRIPAEIWRKGDTSVSKVFFFKQEVVAVVLDPFLETADTDRSNNYWPPKVQPTRFELYKSQGSGRYGRRPAENPMQRAKRNEDLE